MAFQLSVQAEYLSQQVNIRQQIILEIDGIPLIFAAIGAAKLIEYGDDIVYGQAGITYGGVVGDPRSRDYISLSGTTNNISQQIEIDKGGEGSVQKFSIALIDKDQELTRVFAPGVYVPDLLSRDASVFIGFQGGAHPRDSIRIFNGIITGAEASPGAWKLIVDHPDYFKRQDLYLQVNTPLVGEIDGTDTTLVLEDASLLLLPQGGVECYLRIEDEILRYTTINYNTNTVSGITRAQLNTVANSHDDETDVVSFYTLTGNPIDIALKLMLSNEGNTAYATDVAIPRFVKVSPSDDVVDAFFIEDTTIVDRLNITIGDAVTIAGATEVANNITDEVITDIIINETGTIFVLDGAGLVEEVDSAAVGAFTSRYNVLPQGAGMKNLHVDIEQHERMKQLFPSLPSYLFYLKDTLDLKSFLPQQVYYPVGLYQVPRKGRASCAATVPPLSTEDLVELNTRNIIEASKNKLERQLTRYFYNSVVYRFEQDSLRDDFLAGQVILSTRSSQRIAAGNKSLKIESTGLRNNVSTRNYLRSQVRRFSDRYQFAAESIKVKTNYKTGFNVEVADIVLFGGSDVQLPDYERGTRDFLPRMMEVIDKSINYKTGQIQLTLLDTGYGLDGRYGVISPSSIIGTGSTDQEIIITTSYSETNIIDEQAKYRNFVGQEIEIRSLDFTFQEVVTLIQLDEGNSAKLLVFPALPAAPTAGMIVNLPYYPDTTDEEDRPKMKAIHAFFTPQVEILSAPDQFNFVVGAGDIDKFFVGGFVLVHSPDFANNSIIDSIDDDAIVTAVDTGTNTVTVSRALGFVPAAGDFVDLIGFADQGKPYRLI